MLYLDINHENTIKNMKERSFLERASSNVLGKILAMKHRYPEVHHIQIDTGAGKTISCHHYGYGTTPAVFIPGQSGRGVNPQALIDKFDPEKYRVIGIDNIGTGGSYPNMLTTANINMHSLVNNIKIAGDFFFGKSTPFSVLGSSTGAGPALNFARAYPDLVRNINLDRPFFGTDSEFANGILPYGGLAKLCHHYEHGDIFDQYLSFTGTADRTDWQGMIRNVYKEIHLGNMDALGAFLKSHSVAITEPNKIKDKFKEIDFAIKYFPEQIMLEGLTLAHYMANRGYQGPKGSLEFIYKGSSITNKINVICAGEDQVSPPALAANRLKRLLKDPERQFTVVKGASHNSHKMINPIVLGLTTRQARVKTELKMM
jgi:pimeloyl-ACP methyl ester carboxylesterase